MTTNEILIPVKGAHLKGELHLPDHAPGLILFAHGSGSSRKSPRNQFVARVIEEAGLGTLLFDLLTAEEEAAEAQTGELRFNIGLLTNRLVAATRWALDQTPRDINAGYFGSSTGAAAALVAASKLGETIGAVVSRGGRPDLAGDALERVSAPTLLVAGGEDHQVILLNEDACDSLRCEKALRIVPRATHLFAEPGTLETVARMAAEWFADHLQPITARRR